MTFRTECSLPEPLPSFERNRDHRKIRVTNTRPIPRPTKDKSVRAVLIAVNASRRMTFESACNVSDCFRRNRIKGVMTHALISGAGPYREFCLRNNLTTTLYQNSEFGVVTIRVEYDGLPNLYSAGIFEHERKLPFLTGRQT